MTRKPRTNYTVPPGPPATERCRTLLWDRRARIGEVRDRIWSYISPASRYRAGLLVAAALLDWPEDDARRLGELQFLLSAEIRDLLEAMPQMVR